MTKRLPPKRREPWPAFTLLAALLAAIALVSVLLLDYLNSRRGEPAFLFRRAERAAAAPAEKAPQAAAVKPAEKPAPAPAPEKAAKPFGEVIAASLAAAGVSEDSVLELKGAKGAPLFEVELPAELYESVGPSVERTLKAEGVRVLGKKRTPGEERTEVLWSLRRTGRE